MERFGPLRELTQVWFRRSTQPRPPVRAIDTDFASYHPRDMKSVTVTLPEDTALWVWVRAATANRSVSSWLADAVEALRRREDDYEVAMTCSLARKLRR